MKKFITTLFLCIFTTPVFAYATPIAPVINVHDMQMIKEQKFRREEINDYNDVKQEKARFEKRNKTNEPVVQNNNPKHESELIDENGEIKIKYKN